ncbi:hypothetical protein AX15_007796 [Amanita polypyramis BW_CC]|nr:hypothetical protein AX15_007796 [Amanita polypyramis BW_CC]
MDRFYTDEVARREVYPVSGAFSRQSFTRAQNEKLMGLTDGRGGVLKSEVRAPKKTTAAGSAGHALCAGVGTGGDGEADGDGGQGGRRLGRGSVGRGQGLSEGRQDCTPVSFRCYAEIYLDSAPARYERNTMGLAWLQISQLGSMTISEFIFILPKKYNISGVNSDS